MRSPTMCWNCESGRPLALPAWKSKVKGTETQHDLAAWVMSLGEGWEESFPHQIPLD
jgi:hypothetical protein